MKIRYSVDDLKRSISSFAVNPRMILVLLRHTPNPSSKFIDLDVEIPFTRGTFAKIEPPLYRYPHHSSRWTCPLNARQEAPWRCLVAMELPEQEISNSR